MLERNFCDAAALFKDVKILRYSRIPNRAMPKQAHNVKRQKKSFQMLPKAGCIISNDFGQLPHPYRRSSSSSSEYQNSVTTRVAQPENEAFCNKWSITAEFSSASNRSEVQHYWADLL
jgi:hypothetical protein